MDLLLWEEDIHIGKKLHCKSVHEPLLKLNICIVFEPTIPFTGIWPAETVHISPEGKGKNVHTD